MKNILLVVLGIFCVSFAISYITVANQFKKLSDDFAKLFIDNAVMQEYIDIMKSEGTLPKNDEETHKENFIKFLSDSRDWAYEYIDDVQNSLQKFVSDVDSHINYFDEYGNVLSENMPHSLAMSQISKSYKELKKLLPEEGK